MLKMRQYRLFHYSLILFWVFFCAVLWASNNNVDPNAKNLRIDYEGQLLTISNPTQSAIKLNKAKLQFYYKGQVFSVTPLEGLSSNISLSVKHSSNQPNSAGSLYSIVFSETNIPSLEPDQTLKLQLDTDAKDTPVGFRFFANLLPEVKVSVTPLKPDWTQTILICNTSTKPISLKDVQFNFSFSGPTITSIWGSPYVNWKVLSKTGTRYILQGGTPYSNDLAPDPYCKTPLSVKFSSTPTTPIPTGPFVFKANGGVPLSIGSLKITLPTAPTNSLNNSTVSVTGTGFNQQQTLSWGQSWTLSNLTPGTYIINASRVDNRSSYYKANIIATSVYANATTNVAVIYNLVPVGAVTMSFTNAPATTISAMFNGQNYNFTKTVVSGGSVSLPTDTYKVSVSAQGYIANVNPNPINVPTDTAFNVIFQKTNVNAIFGGFFESWNTVQTSDAAKTELANLPSYINYVYLAFMKPDSAYQAGSFNVLSTGLEFNYSASTLKQAIALLHQRNPNTKILVSVGGATYSGWPNFNPNSIANFVKDFGLDGVDIDYEAAYPGCTKNSTGKIQCAIDSTYQNIVSSMRGLLPRPYTITVDAWSISAFGEGQWAGAQPIGEFTGMMLPFFRSVASKDIDMVNVMSYDAGTSYSPTQALAAYSFYYPGTIAMGVEVPPEAWGGHIYTLTEVEHLARAVLNNAATRNSAAGMMMWSLQKNPDQTSTSSYPNAQMMATQICTILGLKDCSLPLISRGL